MNEKQICITKKNFNNLIKIIKGVLCIMIKKFYKLFLIFYL